MNLNFRALTPLLALALLVACAKKAAPEESSATPSAPVSSAPATPPAPAPARATIDVEAVPVEEDFEEEAQKTLSASNLASQLDQIEKEINGPSQ
ncbi:MAG: hypothetical protein ACOY0T_00615 [Myxococcota bacterium]